MSVSSEISLAFSPETNTPRKRMPRRSVKEFLEWKGWEWFFGLRDSVKGSTRPTADYITAVFATGARRKEAAMLKRSMFHYEPNGDIKVVGMPLEKKRKRVRVADPDRPIEFVTTPPAPEEISKWKEVSMDGKTMWMHRKYISEKVDAVRDPFLIFSNDRIVPYLKALLEKMPNIELLFPSPRDSSIPMDTFEMYNDVKEQTTIHLLRSQRASQLVAEYNFDDRALVRWFSWDEKTGQSMAQHYTRLNAQQAFAKFKPQTPLISTVDTGLKLFNENPNPMKGHMPIYVERSANATYVSDDV